MNIKNILISLNLLFVIFLGYKIIYPQTFHVNLTDYELHTEDIFKIQLNNYDTNNIFYKDTYSDGIKMINVYQGEHSLSLTKWSNFTNPNMKTPSACFFISGNTIYFTALKGTTDHKKAKFTLAINTRASNFLTCLFMLSIITLCFFYYAHLNNYNQAYNFLFLQREQVSQNMPSKKIILGMVFMLSFISSMFILYEKGALWEIDPDTYSYMNYRYNDPWYGLRPPGYKIFLDIVSILGSTIDAPTWELIDLVQYYNNNPDKSNTLQAVFYVQYIIVALSIATLCAALTVILPPALSYIIPLLAIQINGISPLFYIAPEALSVAIIIFVMAFLIYYISQRKLKFLIIASCLSVFGFLLKPGLVFLTAITGLIIFVEFLLHLKDTIKAKTFFKTGFALALGIVFFPACLYFTGDVLTVGQLSLYTNSGEMIAYGTKEHASAIPSEDSRKIYLNIIEKRAEVDKALDATVFSKGREHYSETFLFMHSFNSYIPILVAELDKYIYPTYGRYGYDLSMALGQSMYNNVRPLVHDERTNLYWCNFLSCIGLIDDMQTVSQLLNKLNTPSINKAVYPTLFALILIAFILGSTQTKWIIFIASSPHILSVIATSVGHGPLVRYTRMTEWTILFAALLSLYFIASKIFSKNN